MFAKIYSPSARDTSGTSTHITKIMYNCADGLNTVNKYRHQTGLTRSSFRFRRRTLTQTSSYKRLLKISYLKDTSWRGVDTLKTPTE